jgi:hypothetical protein
MWRSKEAKKFFIVVGVFLFLMWWLVPNSPSVQNEEKQPVKTVGIEGGLLPDPLAWEYGSSTDKMSGEVSKYATKESSNTVNFEFPYHGVQRGTIMLLEDGVLFYVQKGQVICQGSSEYGKCHVRVKFDDEKDKYVSARISGDKSTTIRFGPSFLKSIKKGKKLMIQTEVFQNGRPIFTFDLSGLDPNY